MSAILEQDFIMVPGQNFALLSVVSPQSNQKSDHHGIKIRGVFSTKEEAGAWARRLHKDDPLFDIYVVDMGKWLRIPPPKDMEDTHYQNEELETLITGHKKACAAGASEFRRRTDALKSGEIDPSDENSKYYTKEDETLQEHPADKLERLKEENPEMSEEDIVKKYLQ